MSALLLLLFACDGGDPKDSTGDTSESGDTSQTGDTSETGEPAGLAVTLVSPTADVPADECDEVCFVARVEREGAAVEGATVSIEVEGWGFVGYGATDAAGELTACASGLPLGTTSWVAAATDGADEAVAFGEVALEPFGWKYGLDRSLEPVDAVPWTPTFSRDAANPVLAAGAEGEFDDVGTLLASVAVDPAGGYAMWYAGQAETAGDYLIGHASSPDGVAWTRSGMSDDISWPTEVEGEWKAYATNSPMVVFQDDEWRVYYTGRAEETGNLTIGLATSTQWAAENGQAGDSFHVADVPTNPVFSWIEEDTDWAGEAVAHPAVVYAEGLWHLWYSTGRHRIGYAISEDGLAWERYCGGAVLEGDGHGWDTNRVKAAEVVYWQGWYLMTYTGGDTGAFQVGWAMSRDGIRWAKAEDPVLTNGTAGTWEGSSVLSGGMLVDEDAGTLRMWYGGTGMTGSAVGLATAPLPSSLP